MGSTRIQHGRKTGKVTLVAGQRGEKRHEFTLPVEQVPWNGSRGPGGPTG